MQCFGFSFQYIHKKNLKYSSTTDFIIRPQHEKTLKKKKNGVKTTLHSTPKLYAEYAAAVNCVQL